MKRLWYVLIPLSVGCASQTPALSQPCLAAQPVSDKELNTLALQVINDPTSQHGLCMAYRHGNTTTMTCTDGSGCTMTKINGNVYTNCLLSK